MYFVLSVLRENFILGDVKTKWKSALRHQQQHFCNSLRANHYIETGDKYMQARQQEQGMGSLDGDSIDGDFPYDNMSQSSYGSHKNRNFESRSHQGVGSLDELRNQEENEKLRLLMMNGSSATNGGGVSPLQIIYILTSPGFFNWGCANLSLYS